MLFSQFLNRYRIRLQSNRRAPHRRRTARRLEVEALEGRLLLTTSVLVHPGPGGKLVYVPDAQGNTIPDFSNVGFEGGNQPLPGEGGVPDVPVRATLTPKPGPRDADIQAAIDAVSKLPLDARGYRGVVLLKAGRYDLADHITIHASGALRRAEGTGPTGTGLVARGTAQRFNRNDPTQEGVVRVEGDIPAGVNLTGSARLPLAPGASVLGITDVYVPVGARSFHVTTSAGLAV